MIFFSAELENNAFSDDTLLGTYEECVTYLIQNGYKPDGSARIVKFVLDKDNDQHTFSAAECDTVDLGDAEAVEIITEWSAEWSDNFKLLRHKYGLKQRELSEATNIPLRTIENWEAKKSEPAPYMLELVACKLREIYG